jgi:hypothetical protein
MSKGRPYKQKTVKWLSECNLPAHFDWVVFCEPQEKIYYSQTIPLGHLLILDKDDQGYAYGAIQIHKYAKSMDYDVIWQLDDDVNAFVDVRVKTKYKVEVFENICKDILSGFEEEPELDLIRFMSSRSFYFVKNKKLKFCAKNQNGWGCYLVRTKAFHMEQEWLSHSDTLQHLDIWDKGHYTKTYGLAGINVEVYSNEGGYQCRDRKKDTMMTAEHIKKKYPLSKFVEIDNGLGYDIDTKMYRPKTIMY